MIKHYSLKQWLIILAMATFLIVFVGAMTVPCALSLIQMITK